MLLALLLFVALGAQAQTLTINAHTAEVSSSQRNLIYPVQSLYFTYHSGTGQFTAAQVDNRNVVFRSDITNVVTVAGDTTAAQRLATLKATHLLAVKGTTTTLLPKQSVQVLYTASGKALEVQALNARNVPALWAGHADSLKFTASDTTTALRLTALRRLNAPAGDAVPTAATGAAAGGGSPTVALIGGANAGRITLTTGSSPTTTGVLATITLPRPYPNGCFVSLTAANATTGAQMTRVFVTSTTGTFVLNASGTALTAATEYVWNYQVTGY